MQVPLINGIYCSGSAPEFRTSYPVNMVPVPKDQGISSGYLRPADGINQVGTGSGVDRGAINWGGALYRVSGTTLCRVAADGTVTVLGDVGGTGQVSMTYGFDRLAVASGGKLYYWDGTTLTQVTDPDLGTVLDVNWIGGYFMTTDGTDIVVCELNDPTQVNPLKYGSAESDPDPIMAVDELRNEAYAFGRYTVEIFQNVGGTLFPFQVVSGAQVGKGIIGTHAYTSLGDTFAFVGSGKGEAPAVYGLVPGNVAKLSTAEIDQILLGYTEAQLSELVMECRVDKGHQFVYIHLPDRCLVYDTIGSKALGEPLWHVLSSAILGASTYRARNMVWCYDRWNVGDPTSAALGVLTMDHAMHYGSHVGWEFGSKILYNLGNAAIVHELELVCLSGRVALGADPVVWTSYSLDGVTWSQERPARAGAQGQRSKRICWRTQGKMQTIRMQKFRGTSEAHLAVARLEVQVEALFTRPRYG
jgi:hypothetical protein